ncbi:MAG: KpsF/GutQ family sugar-phosphate isomerase [Candidatus Omnitrophota bacterium]|nr:KpsF/GutQ family sugar-phosphate isomerase [Candidatus Omnitrophota bacterium]
MILSRAKEVFKIEAEAIASLSSKLDDNFVQAVEAMYNCRGRVVVSGMGKTGIIGQKISATLSSLGTPSIWLHSAEAAHGDLGRVTKDDVVIILSHSGETEETKNLVPVLKKLGSKLIAITGNKNSTLAKYSDMVLDVSVKKEACTLGLAPTSSTTAALAMGDALAVCLVEKKGFKEKDFALFHPGGLLGKRLLLKVEDIMRKGKANPIVREEAIVKDVLYAITGARAGAASVIDKSGRLSGIFTDGDLRRHLERNTDLASRKIKEVMTKNPVTIQPQRLAVEALRILEEKKIDELPVVDAALKPVGMLDIQDVLRAGLV